MLIYIYVTTYPLCVNINLNKETSPLRIIAMITTVNSKEDILNEIRKLEIEHKNIEAKLRRCRESNGCMLDEQRMKRRKLKLKDSITYLRGYVQDDIIA